MLDLMPAHERPEAFGNPDPFAERKEFIRACRNPEFAWEFVCAEAKILAEQAGQIRSRWEALKHATSPVEFTEPHSVFERRVRLGRLKDWDRVSDPEVLSLDIFDTCLVRLTRKPVDIFQLAGIRLRPVTGLDPETFAAMREQVENGLRKEGLESGAREDVPFDEIYHRLAMAFSWDADQVDHAKKVEIMTELDYLRPVEVVRERAWRFIRSGGKLVYTSEMYLPAAVLKDVLASKGFPVDEVLVLASGDTGLSKGSGNLFQRLKDTFPGKRLLHVGDNPVSDGEVPRSRGIPSVVIETPVTTYPDAFSNLLNAIVSGQAHFEEWSYWEKLGFTVAGPLHLAFARFVEKECLKSGIQQIFFLSRDGWFPRKAFSMIRDESLGVVNNHYIYASREILGIASMQDIGDVEWEFILKPSPLLKVSDVFSRLGISSATRDAAIRKTGLPPATEVICHHWGFRDPSIRDQLYHAVCHCLPEFLEYRERVRTTYLEYLSDQGLFSSPSLVVDVGWSGSSLKCLKRLCPEEGTSPKGAYFALFAEQVPEDATDFFTASEGRADAVSLLKGSVALMEFLFGSPEPTACALQRAGGQWVPDFRKSWPAFDLMAWTGLEKGISRFLSSAARDDLSALEGDGRAFLEDTLRRFIFRPGEEDRENLGALCHSEGWGTDNRLRMLPRQDQIRTPGHLLEAQCYAPWKPGLKL